MNAQTSTPSFTSALCLFLLCAASLLAGCPDFGKQPSAIDLGGGSGCGDGSGSGDGSGDGSGSGDGCGSGGGGGVPQFTYCTDIKPIFDVSCARCHGAGPQGGQFPDLDVYAERSPGLGSVSTDLDSSLNRIDIGDMPPQGESDPAVTARQLAIIEAWKAQGMPEGSCN